MYYYCNQLKRALTVGKDRKSLAQNSHISTIKGHLQSENVSIRMHKIAVCLIFFTLQ